MAGTGSINPQQVYKDFVRVATTANVTLSGAQTIDTVALAAGDAVLVKDQTTQTQNGLYVVAAGGWGRRNDGAIPQQLPPGHEVYVSEGSVNDRTVWRCTNTGLVVPGTTNIAYSRAWPRYDFSANPNLPEPQTCQRDEATSTIAMTSGTVYYVGGVTLRAGLTYTGINVWFTAANAGTMHAWAGLTRISDRSLLAVSADRTTAVTTGALLLFTLSATYTPTVDTPVWATVMTSGTTNAATIVAKPTGVPAALMGLAPVLAGTGATAQTTPIAVNTIMTAPTAIAQKIYAHLT